MGVEAQRALRRQWFSATAPESREQSLVTASAVVERLHEGKSEHQHRERVGRYVASVLLLTDRYLKKDPELRELGADLVDFNAERYRERPYSIRPGQPPTYGELEAMYEELDRVVSELPERQRKDARAKARSSRFWVNVNRRIAAGESPYSLQESFAEVYDYPRDIKEIPFIPDSLIEPRVSRFRRAFKRLTGMDFDRRAMQFAQRLHPSMRIFSPEQWWSIDKEMGSWKLGTTEERIPNWGSLSASMAGALQDAFLRCRTAITDRGDLIRERMNAKYSFDIPGIPVAITRDFKDDYWTCRTNQLGWGNELYLNTFRLLFSILPRIHHLGGHELTHFWVMIARAKRYDMLEADQTIPDRDMYHPDLLSLIPSAEQVMQEGFAEMYPYYLGQELTAEEEFAVNFSIVAHFLYYNALLRVEAAGEDIVERERIREQNAREISRKLGVGYSTALLEQRYKDVRCYEPPREKRRAARALLYRGGAYTLGVLLGTLLVDAFKKLDKDGYERAMQRLGYFMTTRGTTPEIIISEAQRIAPSVVDPEELGNYLFRK